MNWEGFGLSVLLLVLAAVLAVVVSFGTQRDERENILRACAVEGRYEMHDIGTIKCEVIKGETK